MASPTPTAISASALKGAPVLNASQLNAISAEVGNKNTYSNVGLPSTQNGNSSTVSQPNRGTLTANISNPVSSKQSPPVVMTSRAATDDLANKQTQFNQLKNDTAIHQAAVNGTITPTDQSGNGQNGTSGPQTTDQTQNGQNPPEQATTGSSLDEQINGLLSSLSEGNSTINDQSQAAQAPIAKEMVDTQATLDQGFAVTAQKLNAIATGTYPLSATEQSLLSSTTTVLQSTIDAQKTANTAYTGQMTEAMASLGISTSAPTEAIGNIQAAISSGNDKILTLNAKMAQSLATLQQGFQQQDYKMVQDSWTDTSNYLNTRLTTLSGMQKTVLDQAQQQKTDLQNFTQTSLTAIMDSANYSYNEKENMIKDAQAQGQLDETRANDLRNYNLNVDKYQLDVRKENVAEQGNGTGNIPGLPTVGVSNAGTANAADQSKFLAALPPQVATQVQGLANYSINPASFPTRPTASSGQMSRATAVALAKQYDPSYDENQYATRASTMKQFQSGAYSQNINALNTAIGHLNELVDNSAKLKNVGFTPYNAVANATASMFGNGNIVGAETNINAAIGELATAFKKSGATDSEIKALGTVDANSSPAQIKAFISTASSLLGSRVDALNQTYQSSMGTAPKGGTFLSPSSQSALLKLKNDGYDINVNGLDQTPVAQLGAFNSASSENATMLKQLEATMPNATPAEIVDFLQTNGAM